MELLEQHFETAFDAPDGIQKLRELILTLAMQGKLVEQDPKNKPIDELLKEIQLENKRLIREKKIRKPKPLPAIDESEFPYQLPKGWKWVYLGDLFPTFQNGSSRRRSSNEGHEKIILRLADIKDGQISLNSTRSIVSTENEIEKYELLENDILVTRVNGSVDLVGSFTLIEDSLDAIYCDHFIRLRIPQNIVSSVFLSCIGSGYLLRQQIASKFVSTAGQKTVNQGHISSLLLPLPPLPEQRRIVAKIDQLMARCDELEKLRTERDQKRLTVHTAALNRLLTAQSSDTFTEAWQFMAQHFSELYSVKENVAELRKAILQLAVMGKLVKQDPSDEPASELLNKLRLARLKLYEKQKQDNSEIKTMLRKLKKLDIAKAPFKLPDTWETTHLIDCCEYLVDCHNKTATYTASGIPIVRTTNVRDRQIRYQDMKFVNEDTYTFWSRRCPPEPGDIIFTREAPMGEATIIPEEMICCLGQRTMLIRPMQEFIDNQYLLIALTEPYLLERASSSAIGSTVKHLRVGDVEKLNIPIPPLPEQHRIVAKVEQLMPLCDTLEQHIHNATHKQTTLLNAVMAQV